MKFRVYFPEKINKHFKMSSVEILPSMLIFKHMIVNRSETIKVEPPSIIV